VFERKGLFLLRKIRKIDRTLKKNYTDFSCKKRTNLLETNSGFFFGGGEGIE
jgi:hypothetical protein